MDCFEADLGFVSYSSCNDGSEKFGVNLGVGGISKTTDADGTVTTETWTLLPPEKNTITTHPHGLKDFKQCFTLPPFTMCDEMKGFSIDADTFRDYDRQLMEKGEIKLEKTPDVLNPNSRLC